MFRRLIFICLLMMMGWINSAAAQDIRVAVVNGQYSAEISCDDEITVYNKDSGTETVLPQGKYFLHVKKGVLTVDDRSLGNSISIKNKKDGTLLVNKKDYRGSISAEVVDNKLLIVDAVELEEYLCNVLPGKVMPIWPDEAIKAQAVAARTYAVYMMEQHKNSAFDISSNDKELFYQGMDKANDKISPLIKATKGEILLYNNRPIKAVTTSSTGGRTESAVSAWGKALPYLQSVEDYDQDCPDFNWEYKISPILLQTLLEQNGYAVGKINSLRLSGFESKSNDRTESGRVKFIVVSGDNGSCQIDGYELMRILSLNSNFFTVSVSTPIPDNLEVPIENYYGMEIGRKDIDIKIGDKKSTVWKDINEKYHLLSGGKDEKIIFSGHGKGDGLGLSIWGAKGMADASARNDYRLILKHYYPNSILRKINK